MASSTQHLILIGFKHVGKTVIGRELAFQLQKKFIDLDDELEKFCTIQLKQSLSCRQIMTLYGEDYFRKQEHLVLQNILKRPSAIIALGGGAVLNENSQQAIKKHFLLHIVVSPQLIFKRIKASGLPVFFDKKKTFYDAFFYLWKARNKIYKSLAQCSIDNSSSLAKAVYQARVYFENIKKNT